MQLITESYARSLYRPPVPNTHKGLQGHALIVAGSHGKMGAAVLCAKSCIRSGAGLVTVFTPECGYPILQTAVPEAMVVTDNGFHHITGIQVDIQPQAIGIGPGIGQHPETAAALFTFLESTTLPLVADADALNLLSVNPDAFALVPRRSILTPHPKEFQRMVGEWQNESERIGKAKLLSKLLDVVIVLKGAPTKVIDGDNIYENTTGNAALATGGTGDCLTGILAGLLAQGYPAQQAASLGVFLHGLTAHIALPQTGYEAFSASLIPDYLGRAFMSLYHAGYDA